jgi:hypothetical protein
MPRFSATTGKGAKARPRGVRTVLQRVALESDAARLRLAGHQPGHIPRAARLSFRLNRQAVANASVSGLYKCQLHPARHFLSSVGSSDPPDINQPHSARG